MYSTRSEKARIESDDEIDPLEFLFCFQLAKTPLKVEKGRRKGEVGEAGKEAAFLRDGIVENVLSPAWKSPICRLID